MIRKAIIVLLLIVAAATLALGVTSYWHEWHWDNGADSMEFQARAQLRATGGYRTIDNVYLAFPEGVEQRLDEAMSVYGVGARQGLLQAIGTRYVPRGGLTQRGRRSGAPGWLRLIVSEEGTVQYLSIECHSAILLLVLLIYPAVAFVRGPLRRSRRRRRGLCGRCGYNLTGNVTGVCSECGAPIAAPVQAAP